MTRTAVGAALLVASVAACSEASKTPDLPSEKELLASAKGICDLRDKCAVETGDDPPDPDVCKMDVRNEVVGDINECAWLWIDLNDCITGLTCDEYAYYDGLGYGDCKPAYAEWNACVSKQTD